MRGARLAVAAIAVMALGCSAASSSPAGTPTASASPGSPTAPPPSGTSGLILHNATVLTMDPDMPEGGAILIEGDTIAAVGPEAEILALAGTGTRLVDLQGATVTPGFVDSHSHRITQRSKWGLETEAQATDLALSEGWTEICELALSEADFHALVEADARGELHTRVNAYLAVNAFEGARWTTGTRPTSQARSSARTSAWRA
jgi:predicted amidohydrolase YtcJ